ncbi:hypothetical protein MHSWG343_09930 [Candidatus Mycoplasma haematohominis]|uniref:Uncharacterized protein n=2 Tax=Candidatus Mycoplasma haematohominis TaxID=1494318 RepID=A0A478FV33_9MOLU|nr:hypothetical protein MHSWG343_09930 [Candidatus Mycoplasma haemohominis]
MLIGCTAGYFGAASYYEKHPQTLAQSHECDGSNYADKLCHANKAVLLGINPKENWRTWKQKEINLKNSSETPSSTEFKTLKETLKTKKDGELNGSQIKDTCAKTYVQPSANTNTNKTNQENDIKKWCSLTTSAQA